MKRSHPRVVLRADLHHLRPLDFGGRSRTVDGSAANLFWLAAVAIRLALEPMTSCMSPPTACGHAHRSCRSAAEWNVRTRTPPTQEPPTGDHLASTRAVRERYGQGCVPDHAHHVRLRMRCDGDRASLSSARTSHHHDRAADSFPATWRCSGSSRPTGRPGPRQTVGFITREFATSV